MCRFKGVYLQKFIVKLNMQLKSRKNMNLTINDAVANRIAYLLKLNNMTQYRPEQQSGIIYGAMDRILTGQNKREKSSIKTPHYFCHCFHLVRITGFEPARSSNRT